MRNPVFTALATILLIPTALAAQAQARIETGFLDRSVVFGGQTYRYQIFVPPSYVPTQRWPVILFLHGAGERGSDGYIQTQVGLAPAIRQNPSRFPAIAVFPQSPAESSWTGAIARMALAALDKTMREYQTDPTRVYLTGLSMGGNGTWYIAYRNPKRFAAIAPICGWISPGFWKAADPVVPADSGETFSAFGRQLRQTPTWIFHGEVDPAVPVEESRKSFGALQEVGAPVQYTELPGTGHNSWDPAYGSPKFWTWFLAQRGNPPRPSLAAPIVRQLSLSSLDNYFTVVGNFSGLLTVHDDSIVVNFDTLVATRRIPRDEQRVRLDSIRVGVGVGDEKTWNPVDDSKALTIGSNLPLGGVIKRRNVRFVLPHERTEADDKAWLVVTFHITVGKRGEPGYLPQATTYAHSKRGVLAADQERPSGTN